MAYSVSFWWSPIRFCIDRRERENGAGARAGLAPLLAAGRKKRGCHEGGLDGRAGGDDDIDCVVT